MLGPSHLVLGYLAGKRPPPEKDVMFRLERRFCPNTAVDPCVPARAMARYRTSIVAGRPQTQLGTSVVTTGRYGAIDGAARDVLASRHAGPELEHPG